MSQPNTAPRRSLLARGFTLMELLVVVAIIAVLISFLLPALSQARRNSNTVKCLSSLRDLGNAFNMYAVEFQQAYPVVRHETGAVTLPPPSLLPDDPAKGQGERHWADLIAKYAGGQKVDIKIFSDIVKLKEGKSAIWGCPEWMSGAGADPANIYNVGYGMNYIANPSDFRFGGGAVRQNAMAWISQRTSGTVSGVFGNYHKTNIWGKKAADHLLLADSNTYYLQIPVDKMAAQTMSPTIQFFGYTGTTVVAAAGPVWAPPPETFFIDGTRHLRTGTKRDKAISLRGINALFADGHAAAVSVQEAYNAMLFPGTGKN